MANFKKCGLCEEDFFIRDEDLEFYSKISPVIAGKKYTIPPPKLCPRCREQRRLTYRNERNLYRRKSSLSGAEMISFFHPDAPFVVYTKDEWWSDSWDAASAKFGRDIDWNRNFFEQFYELSLRVPRPPLVNNRSENADFCNFVDGNKNCYLLTSADDNEDCYYGELMAHNRSVVDAMWALNSELLYECINCHHCYNLRYSQHCDNCTDSAFLFNCRSVRNSLFCINLRNCEYHMFNKPVSKEQYQRAMKELGGSYKKYQEALARFAELKKEFPLRRANNFVACENVSGDDIVNAKNICMGYDVFDSRDCAYLHDGIHASDCYDICYFDSVQLCYESTSLIGYGYRFTNFCRDSSDLFYCDNCYSSKNCFGCIGLRKKEYCIFNKQYKKEEYFELMAQIIKHMGVSWGEFFPVEYSLFAYNESVAHEFFPLTKEQVVERGWQWRNIVPAELGQARATQLPDSINEIDAAICNEILACAETGKKYRLIPQEIEFYKKMQLPLPRLCPDARHTARLVLRNPRRLWKRQCGKCAGEIQTTYAQKREEKILCEKCYLAMVY